MSYVSQWGKGDVNSAGLVWIVPQVDDVQRFDLQQESALGLEENFCLSIGTGAE